MQKLQRHFRFYTKGAPFPGTCLLSGEIKDLWEIGPIPGTPMVGLISDRALGELAGFAGYISKDKYNRDVDALKAEIADLKAKLDVSPKLIKELTNGINGLLSTYVADLASVTGPSKPVQPKGDQADLGKPEDVARSTTKTGQAKGSGIESGPKPASE